MGQMLKNARSYAWDDWWIGIMRSFLSGGAGALVTGGGASFLGIPQRQTVELMAINFIWLGVYRMGEFLKLHGAPDKVQQNLDVAAAANKETAAAIDAAKASATPDK